jgi:hypothetical protein
MGKFTRLKDNDAVSWCICAAKPGPKSQFTFFAICDLKMCIFKARLSVGVEPEEYSRILPYLASAKTPRRLALKINNYVCMFSSNFPLANNCIMAKYCIRKKKFFFDFFGQIFLTKKVMARIFEKK